jgi:large subunit ribosomal protein L25
MVVSVAAPMSEAKLEALLTSGAAIEEGKEPEVIAKGKVEGEAAPAGAAAAAAPEAKGAEKKEGAAPKAEKKEVKEEKKK